MVNCLRAIFGVLILQIYVSAASNNITTVEESIVSAEKPENIDSEETTEVSEEPTLDAQPLLVEESKQDDSSATQSLRQKRYYDFYGLPPINPVYPGYNKRDQSAETSVYGLVEDPLDHIHRRLQDIASLVRQPAPPPPPPVHFPVFFPVIYVPQYECDCNSVGDTTTSPLLPENPSTSNPIHNQTETYNRAQFDEVEKGEFTRPISFVPINPTRPLKRPAPPVEHGSSEGSSVDTPQDSTTPRPPSSQELPISSPRPPAPYPPSFSNDIPQSEQPSTCDVAVLSCCHRSHVTFDCFVAQGCRDPPFGNLCDPLVILRVVEKFQKFYGVRDG